MARESENSPATMVTKTNEGIRIPKSGKFLFVDSGILGFGSQNTAQRIGNLTKDWNAESQVPQTKTEIQYPVSGIHGVESRIQDLLRLPFMGCLER